MVVEERVWFGLQSLLILTPRGGGANESVYGHAHFIINVQIDIQELYSSHFSSQKLSSIAVGIVQHTTLQSTSIL